MKKGLICYKQSLITKQQRRDEMLGFTKFSKKNQKGFSLIELIVVIAIIGIMVMIAAPRFLGYTKDARVATMKADAKILSDAAMRYSLEHDSAWPVGAEVVKSAELEAVIGAATVNAIDNTELGTYVKGLKGDYADYGIITSGTREGDIVHLLGVDGKDEVVWYGTSYSTAATPEEPEIYLATDTDFSGETNGSFRYIGTETEVKIPHVIKGVAVTSYHGMFNGTAVTKVVSDNPNITSMYEMFMDSTATTLDVSGINTSNVIYMISTFKNSAAVTLDLTQWDVSKVVHMSDIFMGSQATTINISGWNTHNVETVDKMFMYSEATTIDMSNFDLSAVWTTAYMFSYSKATTISLSGAITSSAYSNAPEMFSNSKVKNLDLSGFNTSYVTDMSGMFFWTELNTLDLSSFDTSLYPNMDNMFSLSSQITTAYAKTLADAARFNASSGKPAGLNFTLKP